MFPHLRKGDVGSTLIVGQGARQRRIQGLLGGVREVRVLLLFLSFSARSEVSPGSSETLGVLTSAICWAELGAPERTQTQAYPGQCLVWDGTAGEDLVTDVWEK